MLNYYLMQADLEQSKPIDPLSVVKNVSIKSAWKMKDELQRPADSTIAIVPDSFSLLKPFMEKNMQKQLWLISSYENQLKHDGVYSIFCYQPILARMGAQKKLSKKELAIYNYIAQSENNGDRPLPKLAYDSVFMKYVQDYSPELIAAVNKTGNCKYYLKQYYHQYFINQYISPAIDSIVNSYGASYIDIGQRMVSLSDSIDFYVDYTHTTPYGNEFIANLMANEVERHLEAGRPTKDIR